MKFNSNAILSEARSAHVGVGIIAISRRPRRWPFNEQEYRINGRVLEIRPGPPSQPNNEQVIILGTDGRRRSVGGSTKALFS